MSGSSSSFSRVSSAIPNYLRKTIQNLKEIAKNHSDDEIYAMLQECSLDPNETAQKLLLQDPFHEVKRKRDKRKENKELAETKWRPASQGRGGRGAGRGNHSRYTSNDAAGESTIGKENGMHQVTGKADTSSSSAASQDESKSVIPVPSSVAGLPDGPAKVENPVSAHGSPFQDASSNTTALVKENPSIITNKKDTPAVGAVGSLSVSYVQNSNHLPSPKPASGSSLNASASDSVLAPSMGGSFPRNMGSIKDEVGNHQTAVGVTDEKVVLHVVSGTEASSLTGKGSSEVNHLYTHGKTLGKSQGLDGNQLSDASQVTQSLSRSSSAGSRPASNYSNRSQQPTGMQKVGPAKEWKPKSTNVKHASVSGKVVTSDVQPTTQEAAAPALPLSSSLAPVKATSTLQKKLEELQLLDTKHVIIPDHLQVSESERTGLSFGSFDTNFAVSANFMNDAESDEGSTELSETSQEIEENAEQSTPNTLDASSTAQEAEYADHSRSPAEIPGSLTSVAEQPQSPLEMPENLTSKESDISSRISSAPEYDHAKVEPVSAADISQYPVVQTAPTFSNFGLVPQMIGNQFANFEGAESQARDPSRIPSFLVQQPFDPAASYYASVYRPAAADVDGRFSPFFAPASAKYNGNVALLPTQTGQSPQESANSLVISSTGQAPAVTQAAGVMQTAVAVNQQSLPIFRQPSGVHFSHYPPSYLPYTQYFSPFYIPSPSMHPFLSNGAFPQQPPTGNIYPAPGATGTPPVKYSITQFNKPTTNAGNPSQIGMPAAYGTYSPSAVTSGTSSSSDDLTSSQYKENNVYIAGQQAEGSVWIPAPGRDISAMQATSFYNLPTQGQHMTFPGIYHHSAAQPVAAGPVHPMLQQSQPMAGGGGGDMGPPLGAVYQQPQQRTQINWVNNY